MTSPDIPYDNWQPLSVQAVVALFVGAPFGWALAGGYAIECFLGESIRAHGDIDIIAFRDEQSALRHWLQDWKLYVVDPPGKLRPWLPDEYLPFGLYNIWSHRPDSDAWQLQIMLAEVEGVEWVSRHSPLIRGLRDDLIVSYGGVLCIRPEVQLLYKSRTNREKDMLRGCLKSLQDIVN